MHRGIGPLGLALLMLLLAAAPSLAQTEQPPADSPEAAPADPAPPEPKPAAAPVAAPATPADIARLLDPDLLAQLTANFGPRPRGDSGITGPDKLSVVSVPDGCEVYLAAVGEIRDAATPEGTEPAVEDVVFTVEHYLGEAPLTVAIPSGDYVLALRAYGKLSGFDGGCVRKSTTDIITGGVRHSYHLYPVRKREGEYQLFIANFALDGESQPAPVKRPKPAGVYSIDPATLVAELAASTNVPLDERAEVARQLIASGVAFYGPAEARYLVKLTLLGINLRLEEWAVE